MINNFLSRYRPRYIRSLVYMLQSSEYNIGEYIAWLRRVKNFSVVEKRKSLKKTPKALFMLVLAWGFLAVIFAAALYFFSFFTLIGYVCGIVLIAGSPYLLAYGIVVPLLAAQVFIQKPIEYIVVYQAKKIVAKHKGIKIAIAGSFGKTSMREILKTVLSEGKKVAAPPHSYNTLLGISEFIKNLHGDEDVLIFEMENIILVIFVRYAHLFIRI